MPRMRERCCLLGLLVAALLAANAGARPDQFTPLVASATTHNTRPFTGSDGRVHLVYELALTNTSPTAATPKKIEVLDASEVLATFEGQELLSRLKTTGRLAAEDPTIEFNGTRLFLIDLALDPAIKLTDHLMHRITLLGAPSPGPKSVTPASLTYTVASLEISRKLPRIGPPLSGKGWVAANGCCGADSVHRASNLAVNGEIYFAQRFAIDWMRMDDAGRLVHGDSSDVKNYTCYGADVLVVADGTVVETLNDMGDQKPGTLPDPTTITIQNVDGNHVVLDLGEGVFAFYAHLQEGSVRVAAGDHVKRGQLLGKLGNTGNTSAPHLHFHLMAGPSPLGSNGIPYVIDFFTFAGQVPAAQFAAASGLDGDWGKGRLRTPSARHDQFPLDLDIVDFASAH
jgi:hypothetical protein